MTKGHAPIPLDEQLYASYNCHMEALTARFVGGPLAGKEFQKGSPGRWATYLSDAGARMRTVNGDRVWRTQQGSCYRLAESAQRVNGRLVIVRSYVHSTESWNT